MQQHVESLLKAVEKTQEASGGPTSGAGSSHGEKEAKVSKLSEEDDIEAYLTMIQEDDGDIRGGQGALGV